jgi:extracellular factor (EF) 3-hydroxypalmitic acid methyl ester biosynthesis protein
MGLAIRIDERPLRSLTDACERLERMAGAPEVDVAYTFHQTVRAIHAICEALLECEAAGLAREELRPRLTRVRQVHSSSPFMRRLQEWPRGYAGDFETIEWLWRGENRAVGPVARALEGYALTSSIAQQHRNKIAFQASCILEAQERHPSCRVLSLACGSSADVRSVVKSLRPTTNLVLCDSDADALIFSRAALGDIADRCVLVHGTVPKALGAVRKYGPYHLILAGGLFDYLSDRVVQRTLAIAGTSLLAPGGRIAFTNLAAGNPFRVWLEYLADWPLLERSEASVAEIIHAAGLTAPVLARDFTNLAILASTWRTQ